MKMTSTCYIIRVSRVVQGMLSCNRNSSSLLRVPRFYPLVDDRHERLGEYSTFADSTDHKAVDIMLRNTILILLLSSSAG